MYVPRKYRGAIHEMVTFIVIFFIMLIKFYVGCSLLHTTYVSSFLFYYYLLKWYKSTCNKRGLENFLENKVIRGFSSWCFFFYCVAMLVGKREGQLCPYVLSMRFLLAELYRKQNCWPEPALLCLFSYVLWLNHTLCCNLIYPLVFNRIQQNCSYISLAPFCVPNWDGKENINHCN